MKKTFQTLRSLLLILLAAALIVFTNWVKPTKKWHPIIFIGISAVIGIVFHFAGV